MEDLTQALEGLPDFVGQLDLHQHSYDQNIAERLMMRGKEYLELLQVLYMRCEQATNSGDTLPDLWTLFSMVQQKLTPYADLLSSSQSQDCQSSLNGSLASTVSIALPVRNGPGRPKMFVSRAQLESSFELGFTYAKVAKMLCISERTLQRRRSELGLPVGQSLLYSQLSDDELDEVVSSVLQVAKL